MLFIFSGLPGTGKSTIAKMLIQKIKAVYLRVDTIEQALRSHIPSMQEVGPEGYLILYELARENLKLGSTVITDSVNDLRLVRDAYRDIAQSLQLPYLEIEIYCSDRQQHENRVKQRTSDISGLVNPTWDAILHRPYESWDRPHLILDTALLSPEQCVEKILSTAPTY
ncbi:MAG TPA: AAA family ATPase [Candidatus Ignatzschineria merdigallinarum]|uniref:AAA family ATPase n=1 Tax=Candidatus Ignatzschineria merdigallinarum TaxID=2838621 RepID=A0A9D1Q7A1_9GAMM|nr:AAA family ATPase [Candidatus Ignatzschineria merdigallinarum]